MNFLKKFFWPLNTFSLNKIYLVVFDVDGVLTDGKLYIDTNGNIQKSFNVKDGIAIKLLQNEQIKVVFLSGGDAGSASHRAESLQIDKCLFNIRNKEIALRNIQDEFKIASENTAFIGDDLNDLPVKNTVGLFITTSDAANYVRNKADLILRSKGGEGAAREFVEKLLIAKGTLDKYIKNGWLDKN